MADNRTAHLNLPLPDPLNTLEFDVLRLIQCFNALDTAVHAKAESSGLSAVALSGAYADLSGKPTNLSSFLNDTNFITSAGAPVQSVAGRAGEVVLAKSDVGLGNVDNTSDANKPISTATQTALDAKQATLVSGTNIKTINNTSILGNGNIVTGDVTVGGVQTLTNKTLTGLKETKVDMGASDIDIATGNYFTKTVAGTTTFTVSNAPAAGTTASFILELTNGGSATVNWFSGVKWAGGTAPTLTAAGVDILGFYSHDGGTTWRGLVLAKDSK